MSDQRIPSGILDPTALIPTSRITRRGLLVGSAVTATATALAHPATAQDATPAADGDVDLGAFRSLCESLVGVDDLPDEPLEELLALLTADPWSAEGVLELIAHADGENDSAPVSLEASAATENILQYWYLGEFNNEPLENRAERFGGLISHQVLPYSTIQAVCRDYGYWAEDVDLPDRET